MQLRILYQDEWMVAVDKPAGFHVHAPEDPRHRISANTHCLLLARKQLGKFVYPIHRLDRATSGVLLLAFEKGAARDLGLLFQNRSVKKVYYAVARGWVPDEGVIDHPLKDDVDAKESLTAFRRLTRIELPIPVGRYASARYSLVRVEPKTGRMHQIRRHFAHISHPLVGDTVYGDGAQNRAFRELLGEKTLFLKAHSLEFRHPRTEHPMVLRSRWGGIWHRIFDLFGVCPFETGVCRDIELPIRQGRADEAEEAGI